MDLAKFREIISDSISNEEEAYLFSVVLHKPNSKSATIKFAQNRPITINIMVLH